MKQTQPVNFKNPKSKLRSNQKGAAMIILALIIMILMTLTITSAVNLIINEKKRTKSLEVSNKAFQGANTAAECAFWARKELIKNGSNRSYSGRLIFAGNVLNDYCSEYDDGRIVLFHTTANTSNWNSNWYCAGPSYIKGFLTKEQEKETDFNEQEKERAIGASAEIVGNDLIKPFVICNKLAEKGIPKSILSSTNCTNTTRQPDYGPRNSRGWLEYWPAECKAECESDDFAFFNTAKTAGFDPMGSDILDLSSISKQGANWCYAQSTPIGSANDDWTSLDTNEISLCNAMDAHATDPNFWNHEANGSGSRGINFCSPCKRLSQNVRIDLVNAGSTITDRNCGGTTGIGAGAICGRMPAGIVSNYPEVWFTGGIPPENCRGVLDSNNCWACWCGWFRDKNPDMCNSATCKFPGVNRWKCAFY